MSAPSSIWQRERLWRQCLSSLFSLHLIPHLIPHPRLSSDNTGGKPNTISSFVLRFRFLGRRSNVLWKWKVRFGPVCPHHHLRLSTTQPEWAISANLHRLRIHHGRGHVQTITHLHLGCTRGNVALPPTDRPTTVPAAGNGEGWVKSDHWRQGNNRWRVCSLCELSYLTVHSEPFFASSTLSSRGLGAISDSGFFDGSHDIPKDRVHEPRVCKVFS